MLLLPSNDQQSKINVGVCQSKIVIHLKYKVQQRAFHSSDRQSMTDESTDLRSQAIANHAKELGFNLDQDQEFLWLAEESLEVPLPLHWQQVVSEDGSGSLFF